MNIIFDIDGTLADCRHRRHFVTNGNHDWKSFNESMVMDSPIKPIIRLADMLYGREQVIFVTGRTEEYREVTEDWLNERLTARFDVRSLKMRKYKDYRPDCIIKEEILMELKAEGFWPDLVIDDRQSVVDMWRSHGIICLQNHLE